MRYLFLYSIVNENVNLFYDCATNKFVSISSINKRNKINTVLYTGLVVLLTSILRLFNTNHGNYSPIIFFIFPIGIILGYLFQKRIFKNKYSELIKGEKKEYNITDIQVFTELAIRRRNEVNLSIFLTILSFILTMVYFSTSNIFLLFIINFMSLFIGMILNGKDYTKKMKKRLKDNLMLCKWIDIFLLTIC